ncbi:MAG: hypothetical protein HY962_05995 [Ignavibacteriae bacterium]|nr:hypothetical protein [Ignavibacteriota bacterium]
MKRIVTLLLLLTAMMSFSTTTLHAQGAGCDLILLTASDDSVQLAAEFYTPSGVSFRLEAIYVALAYDPALFTVTNKSVMNHRFAGAGFQSDSDPKLDTNLIAPDICLYGESHPNFSNIPYPQNTRRTLCTFKLVPLAPGPGVASFYVYGNQVVPAFSGYWIEGQNDNQPFSPMNDLTNIDWPVEFTLFQATQQGDVVAVKWITASERGNAGFYVERRPVASDVWTTLDFVKGHGTTYTDMQYMFLDRTVRDAGFYEYRLRQMDVDGTFSYSPTATVEYKLGGNTYSLDAAYPNPVSQSARSLIRYSLAQRSAVLLTVNDALGREVARIAQHTADAGIYTAQWMPGDTPAGSYLLTLQLQDENGAPVFVKTQRIAVVP